MESDAWISAQEVADLLHCDKTYPSKLFHSGKLTGKKITDSSRAPLVFKRTSVLAYAKKMKTNAGKKKRVTSANREARRDSAEVQAPSTLTEAALTLLSKIRLVIECDEADLISRNDAFMKLRELVAR